MNRKLVAFCTVFAVILLMVIGYVFYRLFNSSDKKEKVVNDSKMGVMYAIPADAIMLCDFNALSDLKSVFLNKNSRFSGAVNSNSSMVKFIGLIPDDFKDKSAVLSLHYSSKNQVSLLFVLSLPKSLDKDNLSEILEKECSGVIHKKYNGVTVYKSVVPDISFSVYNNFLIASTSIVIVESSIRHLESNTSIMDNSLFNMAAKSADGGASLHINNQNMGKFFSSVINEKYLKYADFASFFSSWMMANLDISGTYCFGDGKMFNTKEEANFSNVFSIQKNQGSDVFTRLPYNTNWVVTLPIYSDKAYLSSYTSYLESRKKINDYNYLNVMANKNGGQNISTSQWFLSLGVKEMSVASVPSEQKDERIVLLKVRDVTKMKNFSQKVNTFLFKGYLKSLLGDFFTPSVEEAYCVVSDWVVIGSKKIVEEIYNQNSNEYFFSFSSYISQTPAAASIKGNSSLLSVINMSKFKDSLARIVKDEYSKYLVSGIESNNFNFLTFKIGNEGEKINFSFSAYSDNLSQLPKPEKIPTAIGGSETTSFDDTKVVVPEGPFKVKNFVNGKSNYLSQSKSNKLTLLDDKKVGVWTIPFSSPLCGAVQQIDYFKNKKLQMIFCSGTKIYLLDRLGRWVSPFPIDLKREITLGPAVYDFNNNLNYSIMILHSDNKVALYDIKGKPVKGWNEIAAGETIISLPTLLDMGEKRYWSVRTSYQTLIFDSNGMAVCDFSKKKKLKSDTEIKKISSKEVCVTNVDGKEMILNLVTGELKIKK